MPLGQHQHQPILPKGSGFQFRSIYSPFDHSHIQQIIPQHLLQPSTLSALDWPQAVLFLTAFFLLRWKKPSPILTMFGCGLLYLLLHLP
jgi:hypothetical protein